MSDDPDFAIHCAVNDRERGASSSNHCDEIPALEQALQHPEQYSTAGIDNMRQRLLLLKAAAGYLPIGNT